MAMKIVVLGAGAWGTALAVSAANNPVSGPLVTLWARREAHACALRAQRENQRYLPGIQLPPTLAVSAVASDQFDSLVKGADLVIVATPMAGLRGLLTQLAGCRMPLAWLCKGFEAATAASFGLLAHEVQAQVAPALRAGVLSGPSFAMEVARGQPTALVAASVDPGVREALVAAFHSATLRVYANDDIIGVEVGGAVKNVLAIATGAADGLHFGANSRAALITRGLAEVMRLGLALGGQAATFMGLAGLGDLVLTCTDDQSRNRRLGLALARGLTSEQAHQEIGQVVEGVQAASAVWTLAQREGVRMPITEQVYRILYEELSPQAAVEALTQGSAKPEFL